MLQTNPIKQELLAAPAFDAEGGGRTEIAAPGGIAVQVTPAPEIPDLERSRHSLEGVLSDFIRHERNAIQLVTKLGELYGSGLDRIQLEYTLPDGTTQTQSVPSYGWLLREIARLQNTVGNLTGVATSARSASIIAADGSRRILYTLESAVPVAPVAGLQLPTSFSLRENQSVLDRLMQPLPFLGLDLSPLGLSPLVSQVQVRRLRLNTTTDLFRTEFVGKVPSYAQALTQLEEAGISYKIEDETIAIDPAVPRYAGTFDVLGTTRRGQGSIASDSLVYRLSTVLYQDLDLNAQMQLQIGQELIVNTEPATTRYRVVSLDAGTREVQLERVSGLDPIKQGVAKLLISPGVSALRRLPVPIGPDQLLLLFLRPLRPSSSAVNPDWGFALPIETNSLKTPAGVTGGADLAGWAETSLRDLGKALSRSLGDGAPSLVEAKRPDPPRLNKADFKVEQINTHLSAAQSLEKVRLKLGDKNRIKSELDGLDSTREELKSLVALGQFRSDRERQAAEETIRQNLDEKSRKTSEYHSLVDDLAASTKDLTDYKPKYQIRAFWGFPSPKVGADGRSQEVVQFIYRYRYLSADGQGTGSQSKTYTTQDGRQASGQFSEWIEVQTKVRLRALPAEIVAEQTRKAISGGADLELASARVTEQLAEQTKAPLLAENPQDAAAVNINQLAVPISPGEQVEIQVRSIAEAGYPHAQSEWSESVVIGFPDELRSPAEGIQTESQAEKVRSELTRDLEAMGLTNHLADSSTVGGQTYLHQASSIATTFRTPENKPLTVDDVLRQQTQTIEQLTARLNGERGGRVQVQITNETGQVLDTVANQGTTSVQAGFYREQVAEQTVPKGEIVTKVFFIEVSNLVASELALLSYVPGQSTEQVPAIDPQDAMYAPYVGYLTSRDEYRDYRRYWRTPICWRDQTESEELRAHHRENARPFWELPGHQSSQVRGQVVYSRNHDLTLNNRLYGGEGLDATQQNYLPILTGATQATYVWDGSRTTGPTPTGDGRLSPFCVHQLHPDLAEGSDLMQNFAEQFDPATSLPTATLGADGSINYPYFQHSILFNLQATEANGLTQLQYESYPKAAADATAENFPRRMGFVANDKYLIGKNTCGSYLYLAPGDRRALYVGGSSYQSGLVLRAGEPVLRIPVVFQYRMTDFFGEGTTGTGLLGGFGLPVEPSNLVYAKKIGIDLVLRDSPIFSFDLRVEAQYKPRSVADVSGS